ncbi:hypothetical protein K9L67_03795 [Candidatus Woesearchaeota archaeon]|nr:hypothetical protein [Candidatus Woesearchaeota archaeon]MCF8013999.1 hypothetical protein [Candidatus Woesearchaeota archaeon]
MSIKEDRFKKITKEIFKNADIEYINMLGRKDGYLYSKLLTRITHKKYKLIVMYDFNKGVQILEKSRIYKTIYAGKPVMQLFEKLNYAMRI